MGAMEYSVARLRELSFMMSALEVGGGGVLEKQTECVSSEREVA